MVAIDDSGHGHLFEGPDERLSVSWPDCRQTTAHDRIERCCCTLLPLGTWCSGDRMARRVALVAALLVAALLASCGGSAKGEGEGEGEDGDFCVVVFRDSFVVDQGCTCGVNCSTGEYGCEATMHPSCNASDLIGSCGERVTYREVARDPCSSPSP